MSIDFIKTPLTEVYGCNCFDDTIMRERLPKGVYREIKLVQMGGCQLTPETAEVVAYAMKDWAIERGATHFTHWFTPLTGLTAEKHDSFISPTPEGRVILEFSGKELVKGEPDASSFPSGGLRATFEARGYTAWDVNSPAFLKSDGEDITLNIPTAFVSYNGEALDKKVPLLRSMEALNKQALRILKVFGTEASRVTTTLGPEQEYFLVDKALAEKRPDLLLAGRTLFGSSPAKGQEMDDHYFGVIKERIASFMKELNYELWKMGISAKTQHNEVAPSQFELATIYDAANVAADKNQLVMESLKKVANRHGLMALLHEKPFARLNGSGKHNNWSLGTDTGLNLLDPGKSPRENAQFLIFLTAVIRSVDRYASILRTSAANAGNDHRLGANEAPPAIISIFLGEQLTELLRRIAEKLPPENAEKEGVLEIGVTNLPSLPKDLSDRNRTSPLAFTGNKFEFRMLPSSASVSGSAVVMNTAMAEILSEFAEILESSKDPIGEVEKLVEMTYRENGRVIFNGNGYSEEWIEEAERRGLPNLPSSVDALPEYTSPSCVDLFERHGVLSRGELVSRTNVYLETYSQQINIEANVLVEMARRDIIPAATQYAGELATSLGSISRLPSEYPTRGLAALLTRVSTALEELQKLVDAVDAELVTASGVESTPLAQAKAYRTGVIPLMEKVRFHGDTLEELLPRNLWPFPTYTDLLFRV